MNATALKLPEVDFETALPDPYMDKHVATAVARMIQYCKQHRSVAEALAEGPVFDSTQSIVEQVNAIFPAHLRTDPVLEDLVDFITEAASKAQKNNQRLKFVYFTQGKMPEITDDDGAHFVKVYSDRGTKTADNYDAMSMALKRDGGGSSGGSAMAMVEELTAGLDSGFVLNVNTLTGGDGAPLSMDTIPTLQAFGGSPAALAEAQTMMAQGDLPAPVQALVQQLTEIGALQTALMTAEGPQVPAISAALAIKTEALNSLIPTLQNTVPATMLGEAVHRIEAVKTDFTVAQLTHVVELLSASLPANQTNTPPAHTQVKDAVEAVREMSRAEGMSVKDVLGLMVAGTPDLPAAMTQSVSQLTTILAKPDTFPVLDAALPAAIAMVVRSELTTPAMTQVAHTQIMPEVISQSLMSAANRNDLPVLNIAAEKMDSLQQRSTTMAESLSIPVVNSVAENVYALSISNGAPQAAKPELLVISSLAEGLAIQMREPAMTPPAPVMDRAPTIVPDQAPIRILAEALNITPPLQIPPAPHVDYIPPAPVPMRDVGPVIIPAIDIGVGPAPTPGPLGPDKKPDIVLKETFKEEANPPKGDHGPELKRENVYDIGGHGPRPGPREWDRAPDVDPYRGPRLRDDIKSELPREVLRKGGDHRFDPPAETRKRDTIFTPPNDHEPIKVKPSIEKEKPNQGQPGCPPCTGERGCCKFGEEKVAEMTANSGAEFDMSALAGMSTAKPSMAPQ